MTKVIHLATARATLRSPLSSRWHPDEMAELMRLYAAKRRPGEAVSYAYGETENHDPQFYVLGPDPARPCTTCVSRLLRNSRRWYVIEDGLGGLLAEGERLRALVSRASRYWHAVRHALPIVAWALFSQPFSDDALIEESVAAVTGCLLAVA
jgi:hypothetical protein